MIGIALNVLVSGLPYIPAVVGIYLVFRTRPDYDLTLDGSFVTGAAVTGVLLSNRVPVVAAIAAGFTTGAALGVVTGSLHVLLRMPVMLIGLFMSLGLYSVDLTIMGGPTISLVNVPSLFSGYGGLSGTGQELVTSAVLAAVGLVVLCGVGFFLASEVGLALRLSGLNKVLPMNLGIEEKWMLGGNLALANGLAALSGALVSQSQGFVVVDSGSDVLLAGLGAVLLGEALLHWWKNAGVLGEMLHVAVGTLGYWSIIVVALYAGFPPVDLQGITALTFIVALGISRWLGRAGSHAEATIRRPVQGARR
jgi:putative tryptophan/tyrosine transport system permease protein